MSLTVVSQGLWELSVPLVFIFQSALTAVPFIVLASINCVRLLGGTDQTVQWLHPRGRAIMAP